MDGPLVPLSLTSRLLGTLLFFALCVSGSELAAQTQSPAKDGKSAPAEAPKAKAAEPRKNIRGGAGAARRRRSRRRCDPVQCGISGIAAPDGREAP